MNRAISILLNMIQSLDVSWRVFITFLAAVAAACLTLFVFFPLFLSLLTLLLRFLQKIILSLTNFCMKTWGKLVIRTRKKSGGFPQFLVSAEDFMVRIITSVSKFIDRVIKWRPPYGAISVRIVLISCILLVLLTVALWVIPGSNLALTAFFMNWEREYVVSSDEAAAAIAVSRNGEAQVYYRLALDSTNLRKTPGGEVTEKLADPGLLLRYLGKTEDQWLKVEYFEENRKVQGWIQDTMVSRWYPGKSSLEYLKPDSNIRISASGIPIFTCKLLGFQKAEDGALQVILKE